MLDSDGRTEPKGLFALRKCRVFVFTATMHNYWLRCVCELFKVEQATALVKVASALEVLEGDSGYINMGGAVVHSESEFITPFGCN